MNVVRITVFEHHISFYVCEIYMGIPHCVIAYCISHIISDSCSEASQVASDSDVGHIKGQRSALQWTS